MSGKADVGDAGARSLLLQQAVIVFLPEVQPVMRVQLTCSLSHSLLFLIGTTGPASGVVLLPHG